MQDHHIFPTKFETLREQAEALVQRQPHGGFEAPDNTLDMIRQFLDLIQELKFQHAELEARNEALGRAQHEISQLRHEYRNFYEFAPCGYLTLNNKGIITCINLTGSRLLNTGGKHASNVDFLKFIDTGWKDSFLSAWTKSTKTHQKQSVELPIKRKNELPLWVRLEIETDRDEAGAVIQWRMVLLDINEKKRAAEALEKSKTRYRKMMESISDPLYICSPEQVIEFINPAMMKRLGRDATGEACYKAVYGLSETCERCPIDKVVNGETIEENIVSPLDNRSYRITHVPIINDDQTVSKLTICRDIQDYLYALVEKKEVQAQLDQHQKMESIGNLAGGIAHDFNNLLASIIGFTELALEDIEPGTILEENLKDVYICSKRAKDLVAQILAFARKSDEEVKPVHIKAMTKECLKLLRSSLPTTIEIKQELDSDASVHGNSTLLQQSLMNLATNAMHAMEADGGIFTIKLSDVNVNDEDARKHHLSKSGSYIKITVSDTGTGIPEDAIQSIFEPYFTTKEPGKGTGMGLALVYGTIKKYGGTIQVDSRLGHGTVFTILLPTTRLTGPNQPSQPEALPQGSERILFVDDESVITKMGNQFLTKWGYDVTSCTSSMAALDLFRARPHDFDLIITDLTMPDLSGDELAMALIKIRPDIPIILCTGYSQQICEETARQIGIKAFAYKPIAKADFAKTIRNILDDTKKSPSGDMTTAMAKRSE
jgi:signal transduction histidine kinase/PAS domain-containing protein/ActR/RegA family two-component response regulator